MIIPAISIAMALAAGALDAPAESTRPTVRTEIYRGNQALNVCRTMTRGCVDDIENANVQRNAATDAFRVGMYFSAWTRADIHDSARGAQPSDDTRHYHQQMRQYQSRLRISNRELCEAAGMVCENVVPILDAWSAGR